MVLLNFDIKKTINSDFNTKYHDFCPEFVDFSKFWRILDACLSAIFLILKKIAYTT